MTSYTFTQASTGKILETSPHADLKSATARGKELREHGQVLISAAKGELREIGEAQKDEPKDEKHGKGHK